MTSDYNNTSSKADDNISSTKSSIDSIAVEQYNGYVARSNADIYINEINIINEEKDDDQNFDTDLEKYHTNYSLSKEYIDPEQRPPIFTSMFHEYICIFLCTFGPAAASMSSTAYQTMLLPLSEYFGIQGGKLVWSVSSVMLANGACLLLMGGIADAFGRKNAMIIGFSMYAIFSLICGFMHNFVLLCLFRGLQGAAVACSTPAAAGFLGSTYKNSKRKNMVMSCFGIGAPVGGALGYFIAGVCVVALDWRAVQFFLTILFGILAILVIFFIPNDKKVDIKHCKNVFLNLDYGGALISLTSFTFICFSLTNVDATENRWRTPYIIALLVVGVALIPAFAIYELYIPKNPLMPMQLYKNKNFCLCMIIATFSWLLFQGMLGYNSVLYFENIRGYPIMIVACCFLTQPIAGTLVNIFAGFTMHKIPGKYLMSTGTLGFLGTALVWSTMSIDRNYFLGPFWAFILSVIGADLIYNISNRVTLSSLEKKLQSRGAGTFNTIIQLSAAVGLGINSTIITSKYPAYGTPQQNDDPAGLLHAMKYSFYVGIALSGSAFILTLFLKVGVIGINNKADTDGNSRAIQEPSE
jgi:MFS family permease